MGTSQELFAKIQRLATEQRNPRSTEIDTADISDILRIMNAEDRRVPEAVGGELPFIEKGVSLIIHSFNNNGRLFYVGAGTSGRLGILDASECPPTFGTPPELVQGLIAGGYPAVFASQEGAEDLEENGINALQEAGVRPEDVVCGIAASRRTPYVVGAIRYARSLGCRTIFITCTPRSEFDLDVDVAICPVVGPEVVMGSTRLKSGTAQKLVLNMLTTAALIRMGKVYENMMVDLQMTNQKLIERSKRTVMLVTGLNYDDAAALLQRARGHVKTALVMQLADVTYEEAQIRLQRASGFVRPAIDGNAYNTST